MGLILTTLIISAPPMAAAFFQGTLGHFTPGSVFGQAAMQRDVAGRVPGQGGYLPPSTPPLLDPPSATPARSSMLMSPAPMSNDTVKAYKGPIE